MRIRPVYLFAVMISLGAGSYAAAHLLGSDNKPPPPTPPIPVTVAVAKHQQLPVYLKGIGTVQALNAVEIHPQATGVLIAVPVKEGQDVRKGDIVAEIDPRPLKAALDKAIAQRVQDQAQLVNAQADQQRYATLARNEFASRQQLETQQSSVARLQGVVQADDAAIEEAQINLNYAVVRSPLDGRVSLRRVDPGNLIQANATGLGIFSIVQVHPISVVFTLPQTELPRVREAMIRGQLSVLADGSNGGREPAQGTLQTPDNAINPGTGTIQFKALFPNEDDRLTPGGFVTTRLQVATAAGSTVPHEAIQHGQDSLFVFAIKSDKTVERRNVVVILDDGINTVLESGVKDGEQVVVAGQSRIGPGSHVTFGNTADDQLKPPGLGANPQSAGK